MSFQGQIANSGRPGFDLDWLDISVCPEQFCFTLAFLVIY